MNEIKIYPNGHIITDHKGDIAFSDGRNYNDYELGALYFLCKHNITLKVIYDGKRVPNWDSIEHNTFNCILSTKKGTMTFNFYDSIVNTSKAELVYPSAYDILSCLQTYDVGTMDEFMAEFGYEIKSAKDMTNFINTYNAVVKEYNDLKRCLTEEQMEELSEIN